MKIIKKGNKIPRSYAVSMPTFKKKYKGEDK